MKTTSLTLIVALGSMAAGAATLSANSIRLADGSVIEGTLAPPAEVVIKTAGGDKRVPFALLSPEAQRVYWSTGKEAALEPSAAPAEPAAGPLADEELEALANEVSLDAWSKVAAIGSFRDKSEKRGTGGLVVTKAFNALDENWVSVYSPKDPVGVAQNWNDQVVRARGMYARSPQFMQKLWLDLFVRAGEAVARRDSNEFATALRELRRSVIGLQPAAAGGRNFFTAK